MGYVMPSLRARPARVGSFENSAFRFGPSSDCPAHVGICSAAGACALWALGSPRLCGEVGTEPHGSAAAWGSPRPCGEVSYSGTSSEFSRGSTSLVWESSGKMSPTPSASGVLPPHVGKLVIAMSTRPAPSRFSPPCGEVGQDEARPVFGSGCSPPMWGGF